ncbi:glycosyltransferase family 4 protein [Devosia rhizoryzae]|uniref:glycosyltransferase family 4 protein n=1 Tax=Devosia rhizoryzae TaxID=2774137 RepID=UPI002D7FD4F9|nr:glycosyltransferase family 4 protein [Devosia rhizoryzae]
MKQRIVLVTDSTEPSGMGAHMLTLGATLAADFDILIAAPEGEGGNKLLSEAAELGLRIKRFDLGRMDAFRNWLASYEPDLVHVHAGIGWEGHGLVRAAHAAGAPVVRTEHLPYLLTDVVQQAEYRAMLLSVDSRIAVSNAVAQTHAGKGRGAIRTVRNGVMPKVATQGRDEVRAGLGVGAGEKLVLTIARFTAQKGYDLLVEAAATVLQQEPRTRFALVGTGPEAAAIEAAIAEAGLAERVKLLGHRTDVADLLAAADVFVLPSHFEGLSLALLEAASAGLPIVATTAGGNVEALGSEHAFLVAPGDAEALSAGIIDALTDATLAKTAGEGSKARFAERFTAQRMADETSAIYQTLIKRPGQRGAQL